MYLPGTKEPNGVLFENASDIVMELAWNRNKDKIEGSYRGLLAGMAEVAQFGITTVGDGRMFWKRGWMKVWRRAFKNKKISVRVALRPSISPHFSIQSQLRQLRNFINKITNGLLF